jgi:SAM-dependent methyltransferase
MENNDCKKGQVEYDNWSLNQPVIKINQANAPTVNEKEKELIGKLNPKKVLDIGCGDGKRLFSYLKGKNINFLGLEKFERLTKESEFKNDILIGDLIEFDTKDFPDKFADIDLITILGGSLLGIFCVENQIKAWENIFAILPINGKIIFDTLVIDGFENEKEIGTRTIIPGHTPPQYFLSENQLMWIWQRLGLSIIEQADIRIPAPFALRYYSLQKI